MRASYTALVAALIAGGALSGTASAQSMPEFKFSGFGTLGAVHSGDDTSDYKGTRFQPNGAGHTRSTSLNPDSKLGLQGTVVFNDKFSGVVQVLTQHQYDNTYKPKVEWANLKYQISSGVSVRLGRIAAPTYLLSETRYVGYASPWVRPPAEVYNVLPITSNDGVDATWRSQVGAANNTFQLFYGKTKGGLSTTSDVKSNPNWGFNDSVEIGSLMLRAGYNSLKLDINLPSTAGIFGGLRGLAAGLAQVPMPAFQSASAQALALADKYKLEDMKVSAVALGLNYDPGDWFVMSEFVAFKGKGFLSDSRSWYASGGYRFGSVTVYATYSDIKAQIESEAGITTSGLGAVPALAGGAAGINAVLNTTLKAITATQHTVTAGARWDFMKNVALKGQFDRVKTGAESNGYLGTYPGYVKGSSVDLVSVALDFVF